VDKGNEEGFGMTIFRPWRGGLDVRRPPATTVRPDDLTGADDLIAELALARRALLRHLADLPSLRWASVHTPTPTDRVRCTQMPRHRYLRVPTAGHDRGCWCEHGFERLVYRIDDNWREHCATRPLGGL
jgi:hypothetical protein